MITWQSFQRKGIDRFNAERLMMILAVITLLVLSMMLTAVKLTFSVHIMGAVGFLEMLLAIYIVDRIPSSESLHRFLLRINLVIALVFAVLSRTSYAYSHIIIDSLNLGYANPNATAIYLLMNVSLLLVYSFRIQKRLHKWALFALCAYLVYLIYETDSRTCLIAVAVIGIYTFTSPKWRIPNWLFPVVLLIPLAFLFVYSSLYQTGRYMDLMILGKPFYSGRESYFVQMLGDLKGYWLIGDVGQHPFSNMHNGPLTILSGCGVLGYLIYLLYIHGTLRQYYRGEVSRIQTVALMVIFAAFIHSGSEAALLTGGANYSITMATFYWLLKGSGSNHASEI